MSSVSMFDQIDKKLEEGNRSNRGHLGFSVIGDEDEHKLWMNFHWCLPSTFSGRMLRLFDLGNRIEDQVIENIRDSGLYDVASHDSDGNQVSVSVLGGHFSGSCDALLRRVLPPPDDGLVLLCEIKSANDKRFNQLKKLGSYELWSETYKWQIHCYMGGLGLTKCIVIVVNKNNSEVYTEVIDYDEQVWEKAQERAERVITSTEPPKHGRKSEKDYMLRGESKAYIDIYTRKRFPESVNCRNCAFSKPLVNTHGATWVCTRSGQNLDLDTQRAGCNDHLWTPKLITTATHIPEESNDDVIAYQSGVVTFYNATEKGMKDGPYYSSAELREFSKVQFDADFMKLASEVKAEFPGSQVDVRDGQVVPF